MSSPFHSVALQRTALKDAARREERWPCGPSLTAARCNAPGWAGRDEEAVHHGRTKKQFIIRAVLLMPAPSRWAWAAAHDPAPLATPTPGTEC
jgi:hypothetical protein